MALRSVRRLRFPIAEQEMCDRRCESDTGSPQSNSPIRRERADGAAQRRAGRRFREQSAERHATKETERRRRAKHQPAYGAKDCSNGVDSEKVGLTVSQEYEKKNGGHWHARQGARQDARSRHAKHHAREASTSPDSLHLESR